MANGPKKLYATVIYVDPAALNTMPDSVQYRALSHFLADPSGQGGAAWTAPYTRVERVEQDGDFYLYVCDLTNGGLEDILEISMNTDRLAVGQQHTSPFASNTLPALAPGYPQRRANLGFAGGPALQTWRWGPIPIVNTGNYLLEYRIHARVDTDCEPERIFFVDPEMIVDSPGTGPSDPT